MDDFLKDDSLELLEARLEDLRQAVEKTYAVGDKIAGRFVVERAIGRGNLGRVYQVTETAGGGPFAVKTLYPRFSDKPEVAARLGEAAEHLRSARHPNLAAMLETGSADGLLYVKMPLLKGRTLASALRVTMPRARAGGIPVKQTAQIVESIAKASEGAGYRFPHLNLLPRNMFVSPSGLVLSDAGLMHSVLPALTKDDLLVMDGREYLAPELFADHAGGAPADVYSLGKLLYQLVTLKHPPSHVEDVRVVGDYPESMADLILHAVEENPSRRYANAGALAEGFREVMAGALAPSPRAGLHVVKPETPPPPEPPAPVEPDVDIDWAGEDETPGEPETDDMEAAREEAIALSEPEVEAAPEPEPEPEPPSPSPSPSPSPNRWRLKSRRKRCSRNRKRNPNTNRNPNRKRSLWKSPRIGWISRNPNALTIF
ncbi:MAG: protein kinase [Deltaproteobacteria bacterium]|nr:protein kinase [Deltaproteobacteria bacterium]